MPGSVEIKQSKAEVNTKFQRRRNKTHQMHTTHIYLT